MRKLRINLTLAGLGPKRSDYPDIPTPAAPSAPPKPVDASRQLAGQEARRQKTPFNIRNLGGGRGLSVASTARALKSLTGQ